ncbi:VQ motif-containing protein 20 [Cucumis melo var. makuwa]|nr:VQ motif-containing protein 20 [Cucumis melo var. makuwa]
MALVQKLTGMSRSDDHEASTKLATTKPVVDENNNNNKGSKAVVSDDNESSSVVTTDENCCGGGGGSGMMEVGQVNSCFGPVIFEPPPPPPSPPPPQLANSYLTNIPIYTPNSMEFLCANQPIFNYDDSLLFGGNRVVNDFCEYSEL